MKIIGSSDRPQTRGLLTEAQRIYEPRKIIQILDPRKSADVIAAYGYSITDTPTSYICLGKICTPPIIEPRQFGSELSRLVAAQIRR